MESTAPGEELVAGALGNGGVDLDAQLTQAVDNGLALDEVVGAPVQVKQVPVPASLGTSSTVCAR